jgi:kynureninase
LISNVISPQYAFASQAEAHGFDPKEAVREVWPRDGEYTLRDEDILEIIEKEGSSIALVLFSGVQYYTGQWFAMKEITQKAKEKVIYLINRLLSY